MLVVAEVLLMEVVLLLEVQVVEVLVTEAQMLQVELLIREAEAVPLLDSQQDLFLVLVVQVKRGHLVPGGHAEDLGGEVEAYQEIARRLGLMPDGDILDLETHRKNRGK